MGTFSQEPRSQLCSFQWGMPVTSTQMEHMPEPPPRPGAALEMPVSPLKQRSKAQPELKGPGNDQGGITSRALLLSHIKDEEGHC